jgi:hypothetical protein
VLLAQDGECRSPAKLRHKVDCIAVAKGISTYSAFALKSKLRRFAPQLGFEGFRWLSEVEANEILEKEVADQYLSLTTARL